MANSNGRQEVVVTDIGMRFGSMVKFMVKWAIASIPALIILFVMALVLSGVTLALFKTLWRSSLSQAAGSGLSSASSVPGSASDGSASAAIPLAEPAISLSPGCSSPSGKAADVLGVAKQYAARQSFHDLQCAKLLLERIPRGDPLSAEANRLESEYTSAQKLLAKRRAEQVEKQAEGARDAGASELETLYRITDPDFNVRATGVRKQTLLMSAASMDRVFVHDFNGSGNCALYEGYGFTEIVAKNPKTGDSWTLCPPK